MKLVEGKNGGKVQRLEPGDKLPGAGHPGGQNFKTVAAKYLESRQNKKNPLTEQIESLTGMERLVLSLIDEALKGNVLAAREILDRIEGRVQQGVNLAGADGKDLFQKDSLEIVYIGPPNPHIAESEKEIREIEGIK